MPRPTRAGGALPAVALDAAAAVPLYEQLYAALRERILDGRLAPGARLASTRALAAELGVSRFTVVAALGQLAAEGYLTTTRRGGTFVAHGLPERAMTATRRRPRRAPPRIDPRAAATPAITARRTTSPPVLSTRGRAIAAVVITGPRSDIGEPRPFRPRRPPLDAFPFALWARLVRRQWAGFRHALLDYGEPAGYRPLRESIAHHLAATRGVQCTADQVVVTSGAQQAFDILFRLLLDPGDAAWIEEPGYLDVRAALVAAGARLVPVPVDAEGLDVAAGCRLDPAARLVYVSPSHHYPTGATLSAARRLQLLAWAERSGAWIIEDDYDSYFRYRGRPLPALQWLDAARGDEPRASGADRVVYVGTFSKTMFPSLRLGYCVVPEHLVDAVVNARAVAGRNSPLADQAALNDFIVDGHYDRHLRRIRSTCAERHEALQHHAKRALAGALTLVPASAGTHVLGALANDAVASAARRAAGATAPPGRRAEAPSTAVRVSAAAAAAGLVVFPLSRYCLRPPAEDALVLGYGGLTPELIATGVERLAGAIDTLGMRGKRK